MRISRDKSEIPEGGPNKREIVDTVVNTEALQGIVPTSNTDTESSPEVKLYLT